MVEDSIDMRTVFSFSLKMLLGLLAVMTLLKGEFVWFIGVTFTLLLTLIPMMLKRDWNVCLPMVFDISVTVSIALHVVGGYTGFYDYVPYYDHVTHFISSATVSLIGVTVLYVLAFHFKAIKTPPLGFGIFTVLFAMSMGVAWEFLEWGSDLLIDSGLQKSLTDTMVDLMFDTIAGSIVGTIAYLSLKKGKGMESMALVRIGDIRDSIGYRRWHELAKHDKELWENVHRAIKDPKMLKRYVNDIFERSEHVSEEQRACWRKACEEEDD